MLGLLGTYHHSLDAKGRVSLPASFRKQLPEQLLIVPAPEMDSLIVLAPEVFEAWVQKLLAEGKEKGKDTKILSDFEEWAYENARTVDVDGNGRIIITPEHRELVGLGSKVTFVGARDRAKIWDSEVKSAKTKQYNPASIY